MIFNKKEIKKLDKILIANIILIAIFSVWILISASSKIVNFHPYFYVKKQLIWYVAGFLVLFGTTFFNYRFLKNKYWYLYIFNLLMLVLVFLVGSEAKGAQRWIDLGFFSLQPSEMAKLILIVSFAAFLAERRGHLNSIKEVFPALLFVFIPLSLVLIQPDLGTSMVFAAIMFGMLWAAGANRKIMLGLLVTGFLGVVFILGDAYFATGGFQYKPEELPIPLFLKGYQLMRIIAFVNPWMDPLATGYHMIQSQVAIGSGGVWGKGWGEGSQVQGNFLPEHHTDFIFSVIGEELGLLGATFVLLMFGILLYRILMVAQETDEFFGQLIAIGIFMMMLFQVMVNIGMTIGLMPITGLPLPFFSYGGNALLTNMLALGLVLSISLRKKNLYF